MRMCRFCFCLTNASAPRCCKKAESAWNNNEVWWVDSLFEE